MMMMVIYGPKMFKSAGKESFSNFNENKDTIIFLFFLSEIVFCTLYLITAVHNQANALIYVPYRTPEMARGTLKKHFFLNKITFFQFYS